jgi:hypothetical protein
MQTRKLLTLSLVATALLLGGCAVTSSGPRHSEYYEPVRVAPPPPYVEYVGSPPVVGHVWISGYWNWGGGRYAWVPGRWDAPRAGHHWVPHRWEKSGDHWRQHGGRWERGDHTQTTTVVVRQPERNVRNVRNEGSERNERSERSERHERHERHQAPAPEPRQFQRETPRGERGDDHRGRSAGDVRPMPERSTPMPLPVEARVSPRAEPPRPVVRSEERSAPERQRGPDAAISEGSRDTARSDGHGRNRGGDRNREESRENTRPRGV